MQSFILVVIVLIAGIYCSTAFYLPYYPYIPTKQETAVSLNNAPVSLYGKKSDPYSGSEEYAVSLGGAPIALYGKVNRQMPSLSPYAPYLWDFLSAFCTSNMHPYGDTLSSGFDDMHQEEFDPFVEYQEGIQPRLHDME